MASADIHFLRNAILALLSVHPAGLDYLQLCQALQGHDQAGRLGRVLHGLRETKNIIEGKRRGAYVLTGLGNVSLARAKFTLPADIHLPGAASPPAKKPASQARPAAIELMVDAENAEAPDFSVSQDGRVVGHHKLRVSDQVLVILQGAHGPMTVKEIYSHMHDERTITALQVCLGNMVKTGKILVDKSYRAFAYSLPGKTNNGRGGGAPVAFGVRYVKPDKGSDLRAWCGIWNDRAIAEKVLARPGNGGELEIVPLYERLH